MDRRGRCAKTSTCPRDPLKRRAWLMCNNCGLLAILPRRGRPSAGIGVVDVQNLWCFFCGSSTRAALFGGRRGRCAKLDVFFWRFLLCARGPLRGRGAKPGVFLRFLLRARCGAERVFAYLRGLRATVCKGSGCKVVFKRVHNRSTSPQLRLQSRKGLIQK